MTFKTGRNSDTAIEIWRSFDPVYFRFLKLSPCLMEAERSTAVGRELLMRLEEARGERRGLFSALGVGSVCLIPAGLL